MARRASVGAKIFWVAASFVLPIAVLLWLMVDGLNGYIHFAQMEVRGGEYQAALEQLLEAVLEHQGISLACPRAAECGDKMKEAAAAVEQGFAAVRSADAKHGAALQFTPEGTQKMQTVTTANIGKRIAILIEDQVVMAPVLRAQIGDRKSTRLNSSH